MTQAFLTTHEDGTVSLEIDPPHAKEITVSTVIISDYIELYNRSVRLANKCDERIENARIVAPYIDVAEIIEIMSGEVF